MSRAGGSCHCGAVRFSVPVPETATECNCSICRRYGALWAYYPVGEVVFEPPAPATGTYMWDDRSLAFHRCRACGCVTHWSPVNRTEDRMGVNARLLDPAVLAGVRIRHLDGAVTERYLD